MYAIAGLGNPGPRYSNTRHNAGFWAVERFARDCGELRWQEKFGCLFTRCNWRDEDILIAMPQRYMNRSGETLAELMHYFKVSPEELVVAYDDVDLELGALRLRFGGSAGGHHGIENIVTHLGSESFYRVRIGIGRPEGREVTNWVLSAASGDELALLEETAQRAAESIAELLVSGLEPAQRKFNRRGPGQGPGQAAE